MCAIVDANVSHEVFGDNRPEAGESFFKWLDTGRGILVVGGKLREELSQSQRFVTWYRQAILKGATVSVNDKEVAVATKVLQSQETCRSDDQHVLALANVSGARLLFTNDQDLQEDFKNRKIVEGVRGKIYTTLVNRYVTAAHEYLLSRKDLCG